MPALTVLQLTDTHIYADPTSRFGGIDTRRSFEAVLDYCLEYESFDALVLSGDLSMDGSVASYRWLERSLLKVDQPVLALPGNHDEPLRWPAHGGRGFGPFPRAIECHNWRLLLLDSRVESCAHGVVGAAQLSWLRDAGAGGHAIVFMHHPPSLVDSAWIDAMGLRDIEAFWAATSDVRGLRAIVCGHVHQCFDRAIGSVRLLTTPSTCVQFAPRARGYKTDARAPGYRIIELFDDGSLSTRIGRVSRACSGAVSVPAQSTAPRK